MGRSSPLSFDPRDDLTQAGAPKAGPFVEAASKAKARIEEDLIYALDYSARDTKS